VLSVEEKSGWKRVRLGDIITIKHGWPFKTEFISEELTGKPIVVNIGNFEYSGGFRFDATKIREYRGMYPPDYELRPGDILLVMTCQTSEGEILGVPARVPDDDRVYLHNQRLGKVTVTCPDKANSDFLYWLFLWHEFNQWLFTSSSGTKILHTAPKRIESFEFDLPPINEQRTIAIILGSLDNKVGLNQKMNKTFEAIAKTIFKHWIVDFEFPNEDGKPYKSSGGEMVYNEGFAEEIPKGWETKPIDEIAGFLNGLALQNYPPEEETDVLPVIKIRELRQGVSQSTDKASSKIPKEYIVHNGDILFSWSGSLEAVIWTDGKGALNQHLFKVTSADFPKWFCYYWILHFLPEYRRIAEGKATTMGHIQRRHLKGSLVLVPDKTAIERMDKIQGPIIEKLIQIGMESRGLSRMRDMLLPKLMSGEIRVSG